MVAAPVVAVNFPMEAAQVHPTPSVRLGHRAEATSTNQKLQRQQVTENAPLVQHAMQARTLRRLVAPLQFVHAVLLNNTSYFSEYRLQDLYYVHFGITIPIDRTHSYF